MQLDVKAWDCVSSSHSYASMHFDGGCLLKGVKADHPRCEWRGCCESSGSEPLWQAATPVSCGASRASLWFLTYLNRPVDLWLTAEASSGSNDTACWSTCWVKATQAPPATSCWATSGQRPQLLRVRQHLTVIGLAVRHRRRQPQLRSMQFDHCGCLTRTRCRTVSFMPKDEWFSFGPSHDTPFLSGNDL